VGNGTPRLSKSTGFLLRKGAVNLMASQGRPDAGCYNRLLNGDHGFFLEIFASLKLALQNAGLKQIICDAPEGYNPIHDLCFFTCRALADSLKLKLSVLPLSPFNTPTNSIVLRHDLSAGELFSKIFYLLTYTDLRSDALFEIKTNGFARFKREVAARAPEWSEAVEMMQKTTPFYERYGRQKVLEKKYQTAIEFEEYMPSSNRQRAWLSHQAHFGRTPSRLRKWTRHFLRFCRKIRNASR